MRYMLLMNYGEVESHCPPMSEWTPEDIQAHIAFQHALNDELTKLGELVDAQGLAGPDVAKFVVADGVNRPVITDGPYPESKELLAGYRMVDVDTEAALWRSRRRCPPRRVWGVRRSASPSRSAK